MTRLLDPSHNRRIESLGEDESKGIKDFFLALTDLNGNMALATSLLGRTTVRMVSVLFFHGHIYFQTHISSTKSRQIRWNPRVAFSSGPLTVEGRARRLGHPLAPAYQEVAEAYKQAHPGSFAAFSHRREQRLFEVTPRRFIYWRREGSVPYLDIWEPAGPQAAGARRGGGNDDQPGRAWRDYYLGKQV